MLRATTTPQTLINHELYDIQPALKEQVLN